MSRRRLSKFSNQDSKELFPSDAFYAPLFKDKARKFEKFVKYINGLSSENLKESLIIIVQSLSSKNDNISDDSLKLSKKPFATTLCDFIELGCRVYGSSKDEKVMTREMVKMGIKSEETINYLLSIMKKHKKTINQEISYSSQALQMKENNKASHNLGYGFVSYPHFQQLKWRLDVTISNSNLKRVLKPYLVLSWSLSDGRIVNMECSIDKFHELRLNLARVLREMQVLDGRFNGDLTNEQKQDMKNLDSLRKIQSKSIVSGINNLKMAKINKQINAKKNGTASSNDGSVTTDSKVDDDTVDID